MLDGANFSAISVILLTKSFRAYLPPSPSTTTPDPATPLWGLLGRVLFSVGLILRSTFHKENS
jgi:hypothetical protein